LAERICNSPAAWRLRFGSEADSAGAAGCPLCANGGRPARKLQVPEADIAAGTHMAEMGGLPPVRYRKADGRYQTFAPHICTGQSAQRTCAAKWHKILELCENWFTDCIGWSYIWEKQSEKEQPS
jgi:hypothetical protein